MSIEITLHPKTGTRTGLKHLLDEMGFTPCEHLWDWPEGTLNFHWFNAADYRSFDGVEATIYKPSSEDLIKKLGPTEWALHTRTRASASPADLEYQNQTVRLARARFGGDFYNDWYGKNRYTITGPDQRDAPSRGIYLTYSFINQYVHAVLYAIPKPTEGMEKLIGTKLEGLAGDDPMRVLYNALVPFAVASLERFFSQCFKILLRYDRDAQKRLKTYTRKVDFQDVLAMQAGTKAIEDIVAEAYSFQNLNSIHKAFVEWLAIDIWKLFRKRKKIGNRIELLERRLDYIIQFRHGIVHRLDIDRQLTKQKIDEVLRTVLVIMDVFVEHLETDRGKVIRDGHPRLR